MPYRLAIAQYKVGMAQLASAPDCGSGGQGFESLYPPYTGLSPSGKAQDFDSCRRWFESNWPSAAEASEPGAISSGGRALDF